MDAVQGLGDVQHITEVAAPRARCACRGWGWFVPKEGPCTSTHEILVCLSLPDMFNTRMHIWQGGDDQETINSCR